MKKLIAVGMVLVLCLVFLVASVALAKPPVPEVPDENPQVRCYKFDDPITFLGVTSNHFEYAVWWELRQFKNNKHKKVVVFLGYEVWAMVDGNPILILEHNPGVPDFDFPSCTP